MERIDKKRAKKIIVDLLDVGSESVNVPNYDGGRNYDIVLSRRKGQTHQPMSIEECERRTDAAIRAAWTCLTGGEIPGGVDTVEFIDS